MHAHQVVGCLLVDKPILKMSKFFVYTEIVIYVWQVPLAGTISGNNDLIVKQNKSFKTKPVSTNKDLLPTREDNGTT